MPDFSRGLPNVRLRNPILGIKHSGRKDRLIVASVPLRIRRQPAAFATQEGRPMNLRIVLSSAGASLMLAVACSSLAAEGSSAEEAKDLLNRAAVHLCCWEPNIVF